MKKELLTLLLIVMSSCIVSCGNDTSTSNSLYEKEVIIVSRATKIEQLIGDFDRQRQEPTSNLTGQRYNLFFTDLGAPFHHKERTYLLFGDTVPSANDPIAYTTDHSPGDGLELHFLQDNVGNYNPITIPGIRLSGFEVPMEGISIDDRMYIYATTDHTQKVTMGRSVVAVSEDDGFSFTYLYDFSSSHFINLSIVKVDLSAWDGFPGSAGEGLVIFGSGKYRQSDVRLAFQPADSIESQSSILFFKGFDHSGMPLWGSLESEADPLFSHPVAGELSVSYNTHLRQWIMLYNADNAIVMRSAHKPWGPWSDAKIIFDPFEDNGYGHFIHVSWEYEKIDSVHDPGRENEWGGVYGPYQFEELASGDSSSTTIYFTMSTWNPYTVVLMKAILGLD